MLRPEGSRAARTRKGSLRHTRQGAGSATGADQACSSSRLVAPHGPRPAGREDQAAQRATLRRMILAPEGWPMVQDRLVAVSYPADEDFVRINAEVLAGEAEIVYTYGLDDARRSQALLQAEVVVAWELPRDLPPGALGAASRLRLVQLLSSVCRAAYVAPRPPPSVTLTTYAPP